MSRLYRKIAAFLQKVLSAQKDTPSKFQFVLFLNRPPVTEMVFAAESAFIYLHDHQPLSNLLTGCKNSPIRFANYAGLSNAEGHVSGSAEIASQSLGDPGFQELHCLSMRGFLRQIKRCFAVIRLQLSVGAVENQEP